MHWLVWPLPALLVWLAGWAAYGAGHAAAAPAWLGFAAGGAIGVAGTLLGNGLWQRFLIAAGFPVSLAASGLAGAMPAWVWLLPLAALLLLYPLRTWRDAPVFPTPAGALRGLARVAPLGGDRARGGARLLDAGCGLGHGLVALRQEYPHALIDGLEWSWPLKLLCAWRCPWAEVRQGDVWKADWSAYDLVYLFQRPESMARAVDKARRELRPGAYLVSLEFEAPALRPMAVLPTDDGRRVWVYRPAADGVRPALSAGAAPRPRPAAARRAPPRGDEVIDLDDLRVRP